MLYALCISCATRCTLEQLWSLFSLYIGSAIVRDRLLSAVAFV